MCRTAPSEAFGLVTGYPVDFIFIPGMGRLPVTFVGGQPPLALIAQSSLASGAAGSDRLMAYETVRIFAAAAVAPYLGEAAGQLRLVVMTGEQQGAGRTAFGVVFRGCWLTTLSDAVLSAIRSAAIQPDTVAYDRAPGGSLTAADYLFLPEM
ncbi:hypothetical protein [Musicola paradisiaca]|uniref:Uncharacterized protein n=1 Tax=Musicola paradisiaca (strain Ech703) TaxID=579405 RepID=C6CCX0_MUSP7|nr:hypothetical protein [Musicola paradisiaca]ACS85011.1 hypothetical protein Dd703_1207 [Musicola paradisiaca Ech703]